MINIYELQPYVHEIARSMGAEVCYTEVKDGRAVFDLRSDIDGRNIGCVGIDLRRCGHIDNAIEGLREKISDLIMSRARNQMLTTPNHRGKRIEYACFDEWAGFRGAYKNVASVPAIKNVIFNDPATIVIWADGTKTVVKTQNGETFDPEKGLAMAITKKALGNQGNYYETIKKWVEKYEPAVTADKVVVRPSYDSRCNIIGSVQVATDDIDEIREALGKCGLTLTSLRKEGSE